MTAKQPIVFSPSFIWFDLGYTLIRLDREERYQRLLHSLNIEISTDDLTKAFYLMDKTFMREYPHVLGRNPLTYMPWYLGMMNYRLGISPDLIEVSKLWFHPDYNPGGSWSCYSDTHEVLEELTKTGFRLGIISNWNHTARSIISDNGLDRYMDCIVISSEEGIEKPDQHIFNTAFEKAAVAAGACLYVGDNYYDDVIGSREVGMNSILLNRYDPEGIKEITDVPVITSLKELPSFLQKNKGGST